VKTRASRGPRLLRWTFRGVAMLAGLLVTALAASATYHAFRQANETRQFPPPGRLVDVGGHRLHLHCTGEGRPTVVLEAPAGGSSLGWSLVQPGIARETRTCSYDRAGLGWSEPGPRPRSAARIVGELHTLLARSGEAGPYVLVGSSLGGTYLRLFAIRHPEAVAGIVFVDAAHERQFDDNPGWRDEVEGTRRMLVLARIAAPLGLLRLLDMPFGEGSSSWLPSPLLPAARAVGFRSAWVTTVADELDALDQGLAEVAAAVDATPAPAFRDLPLVVLTRGRPEGEEAKQYPHWLDLQRKLMSFSSRSVQVMVSDSGHFIQADRPQAVVDAVEGVLRELRVWQRLAHRGAGHQRLVLVEGAGHNIRVEKPEVLIAPVLEMIDELRHSHQGPAGEALPQRIPSKCFGANDAAHRRGKETGADHWRREASKRRSDCARSSGRAAAVAARKMRGVSW
jgi:pimeloyl-ACP methyl ester carboxylesterase